ncbi:type VI secretion protein IcmF/TssM N-terminal domain-containing protein [Desulfospira joergensenii]|uniref:type VI secretion protein IcmF/TssM N-terminal domain-containing protein n=1 Tax=Desulfospira joergensenii TaxID=53329 RepID=UPI0003B36C5E|nr:type VI secretion protein IcmF/TssM N-terminal domain-containing protein [Desulfospira joergensenii]
MKNRLAFFFKIFLVLVLLVFIGIAVFAGVVWARWPLWVCFFIVAGIVGVFLGLLLVQKLLSRKREQKFVSQIIEQDNAALKSRDKKSREVSREMQAKWKEAVESLKKSHLKKQGNPLYVLPWYMIIGESGTGKTTAIKSADLSSSFAEVSSVSGISGTRNCDWWFFEQAILIDTAGRYAVRVDEERDKDEWQKFLSILAKYRKKEPLNGLIVTVAADSLNNSTPDSLERYGRDIRKRVDELMRVLDAKFPIYIMVTKCDLIQGMTQFCDGFDDEALGQAMGMVNHKLEKDAAGLVSGCFKTMGERIRDLRLLILQKQRPENVDPGLILFPSELDKIKPGLQAFIKGLFQENPYQETPFFRGVFFSSGRQEGTPFSHFLKDMGLIGEQEVLPGTSRGLFLHDFFSRLLPSDRGLFTKTQRGAAWARLTRNIGFAAWTTLILAVCGILSFSFVKNLHTIKTATTQFAGPQILKGELISDVSTLEQFRATIQKIEESNNNWWIPRLGLHESIEVEAALKKKYCALLEKRFLSPFDEKMADNMTGFSLSTPVEISISHIEHLVRRINIIKAKLTNLPPEELTAMAQPKFNTVDIGAQKDILEDVQMKMNDLYLFYLLWQEDTGAMNLKMNELQKWLARILTLEGTDLKWLVIRANQDPKISPYTLADFWGKSVRAAEAKAVAPGFTRKGKDSIDRFILEIESALTDSLIPAGRKREFHKWYRTAYINAWMDFLAEFGTGMTYLTTREQWQALSTSVAHKKGPYFSLLDTIPKELAPFSEKGDQPDWVSLVRDINQLHGQAATLRAQKSGSTGVLGTAVSKVKSKLAPGLASTRLDAQAMLKAGKSFMIFQDSLAALGPAISSQRAAFDLATQIYTQDPATSDAPFFVARREIKKLSRLIVYPGKEPALVWGILRGPLVFIHEFALKEAACQIQKKWENEVLLEMRDVSDDQNLNTLLMGPEGFVTRFVKGPCQPFIKRGIKKGFYAAKVDGKGLPLSPYFFKFLTRGVAASKPAKSNYSVKIGGKPTSANDEAQVQPHATLLELVCADKTTTLENLNFPVQKVFSWSPQSECEVIFTIKIGSLDLIKKYPGRLSFPKFLKDFSNGEHRFYPKDFPDHEDSMIRMGVKYIKAKYRLRGHEPVAKLLSAGPGKTPMEIVTCWE